MNAVGLVFGGKWGICLGI